MSELKELYNEQILFHQAKPRNFRSLETANREAEGKNPLCGDQIHVYLEVEEDVVKDISFQGKGCAISVAAASMMTHAVKGKTRAEADSLFREFHEVVLGNADTAPTLTKLGHLKEVFSGVHKFPVRVKCASLPWHTMHAALAGEQTTTTEDLGPDITQDQVSA
jgi:nitrogen fixation NifU-like protein